jgi:alkanesulfonate monooxygenase SsuD/methylene tetrahydromethanopterin reductase-like flavin-dependent oxidoreductase (luciferase family)
MLSTLDNASSGRLILGMGVGWYKPEFDACAVPFNQRGEVEEEEIQLLRLLWSNPSASFEGTHFRMKDVITGPKPVQTHPKIWLGGVAEKTFERIVKHGDGWLAWCPSIDTFSSGVTKIKSMAEAAGRGVSSMNFAVDFMTCVKHSSSEAGMEAAKHKLSKDTCIVGNPEQCSERISQYAKRGADLIILWFVPYGKELESMRTAAHEIMTTI